MQLRFSLSRRRVLHAAGAIGASIAALSVIPSPRLRAAEMAKVSEDDPVAKQLKYVHDATNSARTSADQLCNGCLYYKGTADDEWARCDLFPGKVVNGAGWCSAWSKKT